MKSQNFTLIDILYKIVHSKPFKTRRRRVILITSAVVIGGGECPEINAFD